MDQYPAQTLQVFSRSKLTIPWRALFCFAVLLVAVSGCSLIRASELPSSPFLSHAAELRPDCKRPPWNAVWSANPEHILVRQTTRRRIYIEPINTSYLNNEQDANGNWVTVRQVDDVDVQAITDQIRNDFIKAIEDSPNSHLEVVSAPIKGSLVLEIALTELRPTLRSVNGVVDVGALVIPGSKIVQGVAAVGGQATGGALAAGSIAVELKITLGKNGPVLVEAKDRQNDAASVIPNYRDFEKFGWSRQTVENWAQQFAEVFSTRSSQEIGAASDISILPW